ncbi:glycosyltransferase involved in cell wall biosynthesis [Mucilaginibacter sp. UYNi724]
MKLLHIIAAYKPAYIYGGPTMSVAKLCEQLVASGHQIDVYATTANGLAELDVVPNASVTIDGVNVIYFKRITKDHTHFSPALLISLWKNARQYNAVHIHAWWNLVSVLSCIVALMRGVTVFISPRGTLSPYSFENRNSGIKKLLHNLIGRLLLNRSHIHVTSQHEYTAIQSLVSPKSMTTIPNFVKLGKGYPQNVLALAQPFKLIFLSRIEEKKNLEILFNALPDVAAPYHLTIAGDGNPGYIKTLKALATKNNIAEHITWVGFLNDDKFDVLSRHDLFVLISYDENFGNAIIESLSVGTPVLISTDVGLANYVTENKLGWLCERSADSVSFALNQIITYKTHEILAIRKNAPLIIRNNFNEIPLTKLYTGLYKQHIND